MRRGLCFHQLSTEGAVSRASVRIKDRHPKREREKNARQPGREFHQHIGRLCSKNVFRDRAAKCRTQAFALWPLHQDHQDHEQRHQHEKRQTQIDQQIHRDAKYGHC